jgi:hypothetical protein
MADYTVGSSAVIGADAEILDVIAGAAITINQAVYEDTSTNTWKLCDADALATAPSSKTARAGIALNTAPSGGHLRVAIGGEVTMSGASGTVGQEGVASTTAGGICPLADLAAGDFILLLGIWKTATIFRVHTFGIGIAKA